MKKSLLGLAVAVIAFFVGVFADDSISFEQKSIVKFAVDNPVDDDVCFLEILPLSKEENTESTQEIEEEYFSGWYRLNENKKLPEVNMILLNGQNFDDDGNLTGKMTLSAGVFTEFENYGDQGFIDDAWAKIDGDKVEFKTNKIKGIVYRFKGSFFNHKRMGEDGEKILRGTLTKFIKGKKVAEVSGNFAYYEPHCWH